MEKTIKKHYGGGSLKNNYINQYISFLENQTKNKKVDRKVNRKVNKIIELLNKYNNDKTFNNNNTNDKINMSILNYLLNNSKTKNHLLIEKLNNDFKLSYEKYKKNTHRNLVNITNNMPRPRSRNTPILLKVSNGQGQQTKKKFSFPSLPKFHLPKLRLPRFTQKKKIQQKNLL